MAKEEPKVVHVETEKYPGLLNTEKATVTLSDGSTGTGYSGTKEGAIDKAISKAKGSGWF